MPSTVHRQPISCSAEERWGLPLPGWIPWRRSHEQQRQRREQRSAQMWPLRFIKGGTRPVGNPCPEPLVLPAGMNSIVGDSFVTSPPVHRRNIAAAHSALLAPDPCYLREDARA